MERVPWHKALFDRALARVQKSHVLFSRLLLGRVIFGAYIYGLEACGYSAFIFAAIFLMGYRPGARLPGLPRRKALAACKDTSEP